MTGGDGGGAGRDAREIRVLVVDDDDAFADVTATYLAKLGDVGATTVNGGPAALDRLAAVDVDCVVSDHDMPEMNGLELLAAVREDHPSLPFILFTGKGSEEIASDAVSAGVTDYVRKGGPETFEVLSNRIENAVERQRAQRELREEKELLERVTATTPGSLVCHRDGSVTFATARAARTLGVDQDDLVGWTWRSDSWDAWGFDGEPLDPSELPVARVFRTGEPVTDARLSVERPSDGERRYLAIDAAPLQGANGELDRVVTSFRDVTERVRRERDLAASRTKYRALVQALPDAVFLAEVDCGRIVDANEAAADLLGRDRADLVGSNQLDLHPAADADRYRALFEEHADLATEERTARRFPDGSPVEVEHADGTRIPVEIRASIVELDDRTLVQGVFRDRSDDLEQQRELARSRAVVDAVGDATYALDADGRYTYVNDALADLVGHDADDLVGTPARDVLPEQAADDAQDLIRELLRNDRKRGTVEMRLDRDGETRYVENHVALLPTTDGEFRGTAGIARNVTDRVERERRLRESEQKYASVVEEANDGVVIAQGGVIRFANPAAGDILDDDPAALEGTPVASVVAPEDRALVTERLERRLEGDDPDRRYEFTALARSGDRVPIEFTASVVTYEDAPAVLAICRDISERERRRRELEQYETVVQTAPDGVFIVDEDANYVGGNASGAELTGYTPAELEDLSVPDLVEEGVFGPEVVPRYRDTVRHLLSAENDDEKGKFEFTIRTNGEQRTFECHVSLRPFNPDDGERFRGCIGILRDVTERNRRERDLARQNERLEEFAQVVGHDLRNPLNVASGHLELARTTGDELAFDRVADAHDRIDELLDDLLTLARVGQAIDDTEPVSLRAVAEAAWATVDTADATLDVAADCRFEADPGRVRQLLENVFNNSVEHGDDGVTVTVAARRDADGFYVADDGPGVPDAVRENAFDSGVSSRADGTGFGLAIVRDIADAHGWTVSLADDADGACVVVEF